MTHLKQFIPGNFCLKCDGCCRFANARSLWSPCFLAEEIRIFEKKGIALSLRPKTKKARLVCSKGNYFCPFFNPHKNSCSVYNFRPLDCQLYPFLLRKQGNKVYLAVDKNCPYIEKTFGQDKFNRYVKMLAKFFYQPQIKKLIKKNKQIFGVFSEKTVVNLNEAA